MTENIVAWRISPIEGVGRGITDDPNVAERWREVGCVVEPLALANVSQSVPQPTLVIGPNTTGGDENFAPVSGLNYSAARLLLWFKSWDEAVQFNASLMRPVPQAAPPDRNVIAKIVDPGAFNVDWMQRDDKRYSDALAKADAILALSRPK